MTLSREAFVRDGPIWRATLPVGAVSVLIMVTAGKKGPDEALLTLIEHVIADAPRLEEEARAFVRESAPKFASKQLTLSGLDFRYPSAGWKPQGRSVPSDEPTFGLQFDIPGDHNVLDVNFVKGRPIEADYH